LIMYKIKISGVVQGVGFRPFVYNLARQMSLNGFVLNSSAGLEIEVEGRQRDLDRFVESVQTLHPNAAKIVKFMIITLPNQGYERFEIRQSNSGAGSTMISPDLRVCEDCIEELHSHGDHRHEYPFINCTNCGPRYSIIERTPYDRPLTSMKDFTICGICRAEYENPANRRFHAQPIACGTCGPKLRFLDVNFNVVDGDPISNCRREILNGRIIGIKGIGGFHLACDAMNEDTVSRLRILKRRPAKPFAVMCDLDYLANIVNYTKEHVDLLKSPPAPIVLIPKVVMTSSELSVRSGRNDCINQASISNLIQSPIADSVAPDNHNLGVFLPYSPHQLLLFNCDGFHDPLYLVMTSGNIDDEPIAKEEHELDGLCDYYLSHDRPILNRCDDSVIAASMTDMILLRRSRGYVPSPILIPAETIPTLGTGAELKISFCLAHKDLIYMSPYIGNNNSKATSDFYQEQIDRYINWFRIKPELVACDLHPDYLTTHYAEKTGLPIIRVQHHHAHIASVMAENMIDEPIIGVSYDGTGYGEDGAIWGGEIFIADYYTCERKYHLQYMPLPSGDTSVSHPIRIAYAYLQSSGINTEFLTSISDFEKRVIDSQLKTKLHLFQTSSMGRLFDCVSAMLGLFPKITFEAQSAMALEQLCCLEQHLNITSYPYRLEDIVAKHSNAPKEISVRPMLEAISKEILEDGSKYVIASKLHKTIIEFTIAALVQLRQESGIKKCVLSGGVMQNMVLFEGLKKGLSQQGFTVYYARQLPANDGAIAAGQVLIANCRIR